MHVLIVIVGAAGRNLTSLTVIHDLFFFASFAFVLLFILELSEVNDLANSDRHLAPTSTKSIPRSRAVRTAINACRITPTVPRHPPTTRTWGRGFRSLIRLPVARRKS